MKKYEVSLRLRATIEVVAADQEKAIRLAEEFSEDAITSADNFERLWASKKKIPSISLYGVAFEEMISVAEAEPEETDEF